MGFHSFFVVKTLRLENFLRVMNKLVIAQYFKSGKINSLLV